MPHRIGNLYSKMISYENCVQAELTMAKNKHKNHLAQRIKRNPEKYAKSLFEKLPNYSFHKYRTATIKDSYKGKERGLKIPNLEDQAAMQAWLLVAVPYIERKNYYYNCGSIPKAGQTRSVCALKKWLRQYKEYGLVTDIKKFYDTCPHKTVINQLSRIFKDKKFVDFAAKILSSMSSTGIGLAIGFPVSHWFANIVLIQLDHKIKRIFNHIKYTRYMDDCAFVANNRYMLRKLLTLLNKEVNILGITLKRSQQIFHIPIRGLTFLSYRFFYKQTLLVKGLMFRISRKMKKARINHSLQFMQGVVSYFGILKQCNSYNYRTIHVYPYITKIKACKIISNLCKQNNKVVI